MEVIAIIFFKKRGVNNLWKCHFKRQLIIVRKCHFPKLTIRIKEVQAATGNVKMSPINLPLTLPGSLQYDKYVSIWQSMLSHFWEEYFFQHHKYFLVAFCEGHFFYKSVAILVVVAVRWWPGIPLFWRMFILHLFWFNKRCCIVYDALVGRFNTETGTKKYIYSGAFRQWRQFPGLNNLKGSVVKREYSSLIFLHFSLVFSLNHRISLFS